ncbi:ImmA/IrrE family metallo-endopeptidase [Nocardia colli]|uniref:ImmA/IrrE family metallo-endopeptidase n=1 Tax=Nocardia colli TaxID=2545717 RepID=UPI0035D74660
MLLPPPISYGVSAREHHRHAAARATINLSRLRSTIPRQPIGLTHSLRLAREQADILLDHARRTSSGPIMAISRMPKLRVDYVTGQRLHGASFWDRQARQWVIQVNWDDHWTRQLFTVAHEFKYILDYQHTDLLYQGSRTMTATSEAELAANYFARYLLVPDDQLIEAVDSGATDPDDLAEKFGVTEDLISDRLDDLHIMINPVVRNLLTHRSTV